MCIRDRTTGARLGNPGEKIADRGQQAGVGCRIGARGAADRRLVDIDHLIKQVEPDNFMVCRRFGARSVEMFGGRCVKRVVDQRRFARAGNAGDAGQQADRQVDTDVAQVVAARSDDLQQPLRIGLCLLYTSRCV